MSSVSGEIRSIAGKIGCLPGKIWRKLHKRRKHFTVEPVLFVFMFSSFLSYSVFQQLVRHMICQQTSNCIEKGFSSRNSTSQLECNEPSDIEQDVQSRTSHWILYVNLATGIPSIFVSMLYGSLSDQMGRRFFLALPAVGSIVNAGIILQVVYMDSLPLGYLLFGAFSLGCYGNFAVINFASYSYTSDISSHSKRTVKIGILESMTYLGAALSLLLGGVWIKSGHFAPPFWCILSCNVVIILYIVLALPESLQVITPNAQPSCVGLFRSIAHNLFAFGKLLLGSWRLVVLMLIFFVVEINFLGITDIVILYAFGKPLCWSSDLIGYFLAEKVLLNGVAALFVLPVLAYFGMPDTGVIIVGLIASVASLVLLGASTHTWMMFIVPVVAAMRGCVVPCIRSMLSKLTPPDKQGILFSGISVVESTCTLLASVIYNAIYPVTRQINPGFCFYLMAGCLIVPFILIVLLHLKRNQSQVTSGERQPLLRAQTTIQ